MTRIASLIILSLFVLPFASEAHGLSALRKAGENFQDAAARNHRSILFDQQEAKITTPDQIKRPLKKLNLKEIPDVGSFADLENQFDYIRDTRFLQTQDPNFPRRLTWLYPDDGCYARAEVASQKLIANHFTEPKKIFVFGNLTAQTTNAPGGSVQWWYHVAVIYRVGATAYVLDPALNPQHPMTLSDWNAAVGGDKAKVQYAICSHDTFDPDADCLAPTPMSETQAESEEKDFLQDEWNRLLELNRDPVKELGDNPPWL